MASLPYLRAVSDNSLVKESRVVPTAKEEALTWIESLPDDCSLEDVQYHL